jgi:hypothetical protein
MRNHYLPWFGARRRDPRTFSQAPTEERYNDVVTITIGDRWWQFFYRAGVFSLTLLLLAACTRHHGTVYLPNCRDVDSGACSVVITSHMLDEAGVPAICGCIAFPDGRRVCNPLHCDETP